MFAHLSVASFSGSFRSLPVAVAQCTAKWRPGRSTRGFEPAAFAECNILCSECQLDVMLHGPRCDCDQTGYGGQYILSAHARCVSYYSAHAHANSQWSTAGKCVDERAFGRAKNMFTHLHLIYLICVCKHNVAPPKAATASATKCANNISEIQNVHTHTNTVGEKRGSPARPPPIEN